MFNNCVALTVLGLVFLTITSEVQSGVILDGAKKFFDDTKCTFHNLANSIHHHEHGNDPCKVKNQAGSGQQGYGNNEASSTVRTTSTTGNGRRLINTGANCPDGQRADASGNCYMIY